MPDGTFRRNLFTLTAAALVSVAASLAAQAPPTAVEQARADSARRPYTQADIDFVSGMIAHHAQAVKMAGWAKSHGASPSLQTLCARIVLGQTTEIGLMSTWLKDRNQPVPAPDARGMAMNMDGHTHFMLMPGMLSAEEMANLDKARGVEFERLFLTGMIRHHQGAVAMVDTLFNTPGAGQDEFIFKFASGVHADQTTEISRMQRMLDALPPAGKAP